MNYGVKATKKRIRAANSRKKKYANRLFLTFFKTAFVLVLFLCVTGVSTFIGMFKGILDSSPDFNPDSFTPSGYFSTIYNSAGEVTDTLVGSNSNRIEASYEDFPQDLIDAFVSIEDSRFWQHSGIDLRSISRAVVGVLTNNYKGGASTLTQQLAKNELFTQEKQMARKAAEMFAARDIEDYYSKQQIFEMYAGSCYFGNQWSGVAQAAQGYFGKPTRELTRAECVVLAGLPNAPSVYAANGELARRRALVVVERMERAKKLTHTQALELRDEVSALPLW